jgi:aldehyde:ferredoxin oxidoreductase
MSKSLTGYNGKIAFIDLNDESIKIEDLDPQIARDYLGGTGLNAKITYNILKKEDYTELKSNPYSSKNPLIFSTGPVTGTLRPSSGRYSVTGISPLTKIWGESTSGGFFCISLRNSGYDALVITGKAKKPIFLYLNDGKINFKDATNIWGKNCYETQTIIKEELKPVNVNVSCIGIGGEHLVKYAAIINDEGRAAGRCGLGALMGSKNLKALAIHGNNRIPMANSNLAKELYEKEQNEIQEIFLKRTLFYVFNLYGTNSYLDIGMALGDTPGYYFTDTEYLAEKLTGKTLKESFAVFNYGCAGCTLQCGKTTILEDNGNEIKVDGPEYESVAALGPMVGVFEPKDVILAAHKCNLYGIDTISTGVCISFLIYLIENKLGVEMIKKYLKKINIEEIKWGNSELILKLIDMISKRQGIGDMLAEGVRIMAEKFSVDPELAAHVKGLEIPMHEPRAFAGQALSYMTSCVGANHQKCDWYSAELSNLAYTRLRIKMGDRYDIKGREKGVVALQDLRAIDDSAVNCNFRNPPLDHIIGYINAATGLNYDKKSLLQIGERINNIKRLINCNLGITRQDDKLPNYFYQELKRGKIAGVKLDLDDNLKKYYEIRGWDWETGRPNQEKLKELGIN